MSVHSDSRTLAAARRAWHTMDAGDVAGALETGVHGIDGEEAARRLARYGPNEIAAEEEAPWWRLLLHQFTDPLIYILLIAAAATLLLRDYTDTGVIVAVVVLNAAIGFVQEYRAREAMRALSRLSAPRATVMRAGHQAEIESRTLVPGDVVLLTSGTRVPADLRLVRVRDLEVDESALTGESAPVRKHSNVLTESGLVPGDQVNMAFAGTIATRGRATGYVVHTGGSTELGRIAGTMRALGSMATPLQTRVQRFSRQLGLIVLVLAIAVAVLGLLRGMSPADIFLIAVALAVSAVPEGLPVVLTVTLAIGVRRMARRNAIIRSLPAVETLGSTTVIGSDKTGTLTRNEMTVRMVWSGGRSYETTGVGYSMEGEIVPEEGHAARLVDAPLQATLTAGVLANEADAESLGSEPRGDPTELALHVCAGKGGLDPVQLRASHVELDILPFEPERRLMASLHDGPDGRILHVKGAPEVVFERCAREATADGTAPFDRERVETAARALGERGLRVLAMAYRETTADHVDEALPQGKLVFAGLQGLEDPVRPEAVQAVTDAHGAGVRVLMLTGDHAATARAIGRQLGLGANGDAQVIEGREIATLSDEQLDARLADVDIYARVAPEHKLRIVERLIHQGHIVAVTGDGVNDAPALRAAHIGIAMGRGGTDVAREASDMVLADDNFATIAAAIEEGRVVFSNIRKVTFFLLSTAVGEVVTILIALAAGWPLPFVAAQILWINLVTNGIQDVALAFEPGEPGLLRRRPRPVHGGIVDLRMLERLLGVGLILAAGTLGMFWWSLQQSGDLAYARTIAMTQMVVFQFYHAFNSRSLDRSIFRIPLFSNPLLFAGVLLAALAHLSVLYLGPLQRVFGTVPIPVEAWGWILLVGTTVTLGGEFDKWRNRRRARPIG